MLHDLKADTNSAAEMLVYYHELVQFRATRNPCVVTDSYSFAAVPSPYLVRSKSVPGLNADRAPLVPCGTRVLVAAMRIPAMPRGWLQTPNTPAVKSP